MSHRNKPGPAPLLSAEQKAEAVQMYLDGATYQKIADLFGVSSSTIQKYASQAGQAGKGGHEVRLGPIRQQVLVLWREGLSVAEIARRLDQPTVNVRHWTKSVKGGPSLGLAKEAEQSVARYLQGETIGAIAKSLGRAESTVSSWIHDAGITVLKGTERMTHEQRVAYAKKGAEVTKAIHTAKARYRVCDLPSCPNVFRLRNINDRQTYCCREHAGIARRDPEKRITVKCARPGCPKSFETWAAHPAKYCSRECWAKMSPSQIIVRDEQGNDVKLDSTWEAFLWGYCGVRKIRISRVDRDFAVQWRKGNWYAPDFVVAGHYVEVKGYEDPDDQARWEAWNATHLDRPLTIMREDDLLDLDLWAKKQGISS